MTANGRPNQAMSAIIVDDELDSLARLRRQLTKYCEGKVTIVAESSTPEQAIEFIEAHRPSLVFLDIRMPRIDGFQLLSKLKFRNFYLVVTTAHSRYGMRALKASAIDFLLKPIDPMELMEAVEKIRRANRLGEILGVSQSAKHLQLLMHNLHSSSYPSKLAIPMQDNRIVIDVVDIVSISADGNYARFVMRNGQRFLVAKTLKSYSELLDCSMFLRIHKSHLVNRQFIQGTQGSKPVNLLLKDGQELPIARRRLRMVLDSILR